MATHLPPLRPLGPKTVTKATTNKPVVREQLPRLYGVSECDSASRSATPSPVHASERDSVTTTMTPLWPVAAATDLRPDSARYRAPNVALQRVDTPAEGRRDRTRYITRFIHSAMMKHEPTRQRASVVLTRPSHVGHDVSDAATMASHEATHRQAAGELEDIIADEGEDATGAVVRYLFCQRGQTRQEAISPEVDKLSNDEFASPSTNESDATALAEATPQMSSPPPSRRNVDVTGRVDAQSAETVYVDDETTTRYRLWPTAAQRELRWLPYTEHYERQILESAAQQPWREASRQGEQRAIALRGKLAAAAQSVHFMSDVTVRAQVEAAMHKALVHLCKLHTPQLKVVVQPAAVCNAVPVPVAVHGGSALSSEEQRQLLRTCVDIATQHKTIILQYSLWQMTQLWQQSQLVCAEWRERGVLQEALTHNPLMQRRMHILCSAQPAVDETCTLAGARHPLRVFALVALESHEQTCQAWLQEHIETTLPNAREQRALFAACEEAYEGVIVQEQRTWRRLTAYHQCCLMFASLHRDTVPSPTTAASSAARTTVVERRPRRPGRTPSLQAMQTKLRLCRARMDSPFCSYAMFRALDAVLLMQHDLAGRLVAAEATAWQALMHDERLARDCTQLQDAEAAGRVAVRRAEAAASAQLCDAMCATEMACLGREAADRLAEARRRATAAALAALVRDGYASKVALMQDYMQAMEAMHKNARSELYHRAVEVAQHVEDAALRAQRWLAERVMQEITEREARLRYDIECAETSAARVMWHIYGCTVRDLAASHTALVHAEAQRRAVLVEVLQPEQAQRAQILAECRKAYATLYAPTLCRPVAFQSTHDTCANGLDLRRRIVSSLRDFLDTDTIALFF